MRFADLAGPVCQGCAGSPSSRELHGGRVAVEINPEPGPVAGPEAVVIEDENAAPRAREEDSED